MGSEPWGTFDSEMRWQGPNMIVMDAEGTGLSLEELREAARDPELQQRVASRRLLVSMGCPADGRARMRDVIGVVVRLEAEPDDSPWGLRAAFDDLDTPAGRAYRDLWASKNPDGVDIRPRLIGVGAKISGFCVEIINL